MPTDLVLLTGATGFLGYITLIELLKAGYRVRAAARSQSKIAKVEAAPSFKALGASIEWVIVPDMTVDRAYDEAVKGVKYIVHVASPIPTLGAEAIPADQLEQHFLHQAAKSEVEILQSAQRAGSVERVIVTSSGVAIVPFDYLIGKGDYSIEFSDDHRIPDVMGPFDFEFQAYSAGKAAALNASEAWMASHKPSFDLISIIPGWIFGRDELVADVEGLSKGSTNSVLLGLLLGNKSEAPYNGNVVFGEDVAKLHVLALDSKVKGNQSFNAAFDFEWEAALDVVKTSFAQEVAAGKLSVEGKMPTLPLKMSNRKTKETFAFEFTPLNEIVESVANQYLELEAKL